MKEKKKKNKVIISDIIISIILGIMIWVCIEEYKEIKIKQNVKLQYNTENIITQDNNELKTQEKILTNIIKEYPKEEIISEYKGYEVAAKLEIPKIELETYILQNYSIEALKVCVTKFWGANANEIGNFCIAGHNFNNKNMFRNLNKLEVGDKIFISDNKIGKIEYEIYDIYIVKPEDVDCLSQETNGKRIVTLITCTNDSKNRVIVKAKEIET